MSITPFRERSLNIGEGAGGKLGGPGKIALYKGGLELFLIFQGGSEIFHDILQVKLKVSSLHLGLDMFYLVLSILFPHVIYV